MVAVPKSVAEFEPVEALEPRKAPENAELEKAEIRRAALDCYLNTIGNIAHSATALDGGTTSPYREYVNALVIEVEAGTPEALRATMQTCGGFFATTAIKLRRTSTSSERNWWIQPTLCNALDTCSQAEGDPATPLQRAVCAARELPHGALTSARE